MLRAVLEVFDVVILYSYDGPITFLWLAKLLSVKSLYLYFWQVVNGMPLLSINLANRTKQIIS